jgi:hypothetical protein
VQVESTVVRDSDAEHVPVVVAIEVESRERPQSSEESEADSCRGNTFK